VQVDPIKPTLKPPGTERLKLNCEILLSTSDFKFNLRRYTKEAAAAAISERDAAASAKDAAEKGGAEATAAGACTRSLFGSTSALSVE